MLPLLIFLLATLVAVPASAQDVRGAARVIDAGTLEVSGEILQLYGIVAPAPGNLCPMREQTIDCGRVAATALLDLTAGSKVHCRVLDPAAEPPIARCTADGYDLSEGMVYTGWARVLPDGSARLRQNEELARGRNHGLWQGAFPAHVNAATQ